MKNELSINFGRGIQGDCTHWGELGMTQMAPGTRKANARLKRVQLWLHGAK